MDADIEAAALAAKQLNLVTRDQALRCGLTDRRIRHRVDTGRWARVHRGVYRLGPAAGAAQDALAACLAAGPGAVASHRTAGGLWGILEHDGGIEITVDATRRPELSGVIVHRSHLLRPHERVTLERLPLTAPGKTLLDLAGGLEAGVLEIATDEAFRRDRISPARLVAYLADPAFRRAPGSGRLRALAADRAHLGVPESTLETKLLQLMRRFRLPPAVRQYPVRLSGSMKHIDFAYPEAWVAVETDGYDPHAGRVPFQKDRNRWIELERIGWTVLPFTWWDVHDQPLYVVTTIADAIGLRPTGWTKRRRTSFRRKGG